MEHPKISAIVPIYNTEKYIKKCIDSLLAQTINDIEIILIDDGSSDNSGKICDVYAEKYKNIRVIHQENQGVSAARNAGIKAAKGEYLGFVDSDDWVEPETYQAMVKKLEEEDGSICYCVCRYENEDIVKYYPGTENQMNAENALRLLAKGDFISSVDTSLYRKSDIHGVLFHEDIIYWEDLDFQIYALISVRSVVIEYNPFYHVTKHDKSATANKVSKTNLSCLKIAEKLMTANVSESMRWIVDTVRYKVLSDLISSMAKRGIEKEEEAEIFKEIKGQAQLCYKRIRHTNYVTQKGIIVMRSMCFYPKATIKIISFLFRML